MLTDSAFSLLTVADTLAVSTAQKGRNMVSIKGLDKAKVLAALHNGTQPLGMGRLHDIGHCSNEQAKNDIEAMGGRLRFDYYRGRPLKVDISGDEFEEFLYDRDAGHGAAERAIAAIRQ